MSVNRLLGLIYFFMEEYLGTRPFGLVLEF